MPSAIMLRCAGSRSVLSPSTSATLAEFRQSVEPHLQEMECAFGRNELAERCPTLVLARR